MQVMLLNQLRPPPPPPPFNGRERLVKFFNLYLWNFIHMIIRVEFSSMPNFMIFGIACKWDLLPLRFCACMAKNRQGLVR